MKKYSSKFDFYHLFDFQLTLYLRLNIILNQMSKFTLFLFALFTIATSFSQNKVQIPLNGRDYLISKNMTNDGFVLQMGMSMLETKQQNTEIGNFVALSQSQLNNIYQEGIPNIPVLTRLIEVPQNAEVVFNVLSYTEQIIHLSDYGMADKIIPANRSQSKSETNVSLSKNDVVYQTNAYFNTEIARYFESGQMRETRLGRIEISPIQYNPVENTLRILNDLEVEIRFVNADHTGTKAIKAKYEDAYSSYANGSLLNQLNYGTRELISQAPTHLVIISDRMFEAQLAPFIAWKVKKGFKVTVGYTDVVGTTNAAIKTYLQNIYQGSTPMRFVLFVGDVAQVPAWQATGHVTDLRYCEYTGDNLPEVYYGRFSAQTTAQLQPQLDKSLMYEQFLMPNPAYLSDVLLVAGDDSSHEMTWGNGQLYYGQNYYFTAANNTNTTTYLQPLDNAAIHTQIINRVNAGLGYTNYTAHCGSDGWSSPSFTVSDANALTNNGKYGLLVGNCCQSVKFEESTCFGEAILRKSNAGAMGYIGASDYSYWDEDYWWGVGLTSSIVAQPTYAASGRGAYDGYWHQLANEVNNTATWYTTQAQMVVCGNIAVEASTSSLKQYYWEIYHLMGDPSVTPFIGTPQAMPVTPNPSALMIGMTSLQVTAAPYAYVALSQNGVLIAAGLANTSGVVTLNFASSALAVGTANLVVTAQNRVPYIGTLTISPANEPYVTLQTYATTVTPDFNQNVGLNVTLENVAASGSGFNANGVNATVSTTDAYVTISDNNQVYGQIIAGTSQLQDNAFAFTVANNVPDQHVASFNMVITDNAGHTWNAVMNVTLNAPAFTILNLTINDAAGNNDGILDPGETADLIIQTTQSGHAAVSNVLGNISSTSTDLTLNSVTTSPVSMAIGATQSFTFNVTASAATPQGTAANIHYTVTGGTANQYTNAKDFQVIIGFVPSYCAAGASTTTDEFIQQVQFNTINNSSTQGPDYTDYTSISTTVYKGSSYPITITNGEDWSGDQMGCWIDWNYDGDFDDANETFPITYVNPNGTGNIVVPNDAHIGPTRMRLRVAYTGEYASCNDTSYGEVEDYTVNVQAALGIEDSFENTIGLYPNPNQGSFTIYLNDKQNDESVSIEVFNSLGQVVYHSQSNLAKMNISLDQAQGVYFVKVASGNKSAVKKIIINP